MGPKALVLPCCRMLLLTRGAAGIGVGPGERGGATRALEDQAAVGRACAVAQNLADGDRITAVIDDSRRPRSHSALVKMPAWEPTRAGPAGLERPAVEVQGVAAIALDTKSSLQPSTPLLPPFWMFDPPLNVAPLTACTGIRAMRDRLLALTEPPVVIVGQAVLLPMLSSTEI